MLRRNENHMTEYNPFREMENLERAFFTNPFSYMLDESFSSNMKADITDEGDSYEMKLDLPGFDKNDVNIDIDDEMLTVTASRHSEHEEKDKRGKYLRCERSYGSYKRTFSLSDIDSSAVRAKYDNGVLSLTLPKKQLEVIKGRRLEIE